MIRAIIVDDELPSLKKLEKLLGGSGLAEVSGVFTRAREALDFLKENKVEAAFLDIEMPDIDGIELASRILDLQSQVNIVFVTAYNQYAVEAFRLNALDYLLKPVTAERLGKALSRIAGEKNGAAGTEGISIHCFGKFTVAARGREIRFRTEKAEELLAFLIDHKGGYVSRSKILDTLWEDFDGDRAVIHFNTTLHYVKKALLPYGIRISIQFDRGSYKLDLKNLDCDYLKFCSFEVSSGAAAQDKNGTAGRERNRAVDREIIHAFEEAAALYTGEYLADRDYCWAARRRLLLEEQFIELLLLISKYYKGNAEYPKAINWLKAGLQHEPLHRELNYRLVEILLLTHEQILASKHYDLYRNGLAKKLGLEPDEGFRKLMHQRRPAGSSPE